MGLSINRCFEAQRAKDLPLIPERWDSNQGLLKGKNRPLWEYPSYGVTPSHLSSKQSWGNGQPQWEKRAQGLLRLPPPYSVCCLGFPICTTRKARLSLDGVVLSSNNIMNAESSAQRMGDSKYPINIRYSPSLSIVIIMWK